MTEYLLWDQIFSKLKKWDSNLSILAFYSIFLNFFGDLKYKTLGLTEPEMEESVLVKIESLLVKTEAKQNQ